MLHRHLVCRWPTIFTLAPGCAPKLPPGTRFSIFISPMPCWATITHTIVQSPSQRSPSSSKAAYAKRPLPHHAPHNQSSEMIDYPDEIIVIFVLCRRMDYKFCVSQLYLRIGNCTMNGLTGAGNTENHFS